MLSKEQTFTKAEFPVYSSESTNGGVIGYTDNPDFICDYQHPIYITFGDHTRTFNVVQKSFSVLDNVKVLLPCTDNVNCLLFFIAAWQKQIPNLGYARHWKVAKDCIIQLPEKSKGKIDFEFIDNFVRELERARLRELERARLRELEAYLVATGLNNYELTAIDHFTLDKFKQLQWKEFRIGDLFERVHTLKLPYKAKELSKQPTADCSLPCLTSSFMNQGLNYYIPRKGATILNNVISIPSNSDVYKAYYQSRDFTVLSDAYAIQWKDENVKLTGKQYLFMVACINKVTDLPIYSYKNKLGGWNVVKDKYITLPTKDGVHPDLAAMEQLSTTLQKIVIADVAKYTARNLEATQQVIEAEEEQKELKITLIHPDYQPGRIPLYTLRAACGYFDDGQVPEEEGWIDVSGLGFTPDPKRHFAVHAKGDSMLPKIKDGDICIFEWYNAGSRNGEIVLSQSREYDSEYGGKYTIKRYHSEKVVTEEGWQHSKVELQPLNPDFEPIELDEFGEYKTIGIFKCVL